MTPEEENKKWLYIQDLEAELDYYGLYEPEDRESILRLIKQIDDIYEELGFPEDD